MDMRLPALSERDGSAIPAAADEGAAVEGAAAEEKAGPRSRILAGSLAALLAAWIFCRPPVERTLSEPAIFLMSVRYACLTLAAGFAGALIPFQRARSEWGFLSGAAPYKAALSWTLFPPAILLLREQSMWALPVVTAASAALAICLRKTALHPPLPPAAWIAYKRETPYFAEPLRFLPRRRMAVLSSLCFHATVLVLLLPSVLAGSVLLAAGAFGPASQVAGWNADPEEPRKGRTRSAQRLAMGTVLTILITAMALLPWLPGKNVPPGSLSAQDRAEAAAKAKETKTASAGVRADGYRALILWPAPEKTPMVLPPVPHPAQPKPSRFSSPLVIPFTGPYWYSREPGRWPGANAHVAHGSPLTAMIRSSDSRPLLMAAHQQLGAPIDLTCCSRIEVAIRNGDLRPGSLALGLYFTDSTLPGKPSQFLDAQPILSNRSGSFSAGHAPEDEILSFPIRNDGQIRKFDEITVVYLAGVAHSTDGAKIAIRSFTLFPR
jgi:hypothetical protein